MISHLFVHTNHTPVIILCTTAAIAFATIDFYYSTTGVINDIYQVDGVLQLIFLALWVAIFLKHARQ